MRDVLPMSYLEQAWFHFLCSLNHAGKALYALLCCPRLVASVSALLLFAIILYFAAHP